MTKPGSAGILPAIKERRPRCTGRDASAPRFRISSFFRHLSFVIRHSSFLSASPAIGNEKVGHYQPNYDSQATPKDRPLCPAGIGAGVKPPAGAEVAEEVAH